MTSQDDTDLAALILIISSVSLPTSAPSWRHTKHILGHCRKTPIRLVYPGHHIEHLIYEESVVTDEDQPHHEMTAGKMSEHDEKKRMEITHETAIRRGVGGRTRRVDVVMKDLKAVALVDIEGGDLILMDREVVRTMIELGSEDDDRQRGEEIVTTRHDLYDFSRCNVFSCGKCILKVERNIGCFGCRCYFSLYLFKPHSTLLKMP